MKKNIINYDKNVVIIKISVKNITPDDPISFFKFGTTVQLLNCLFIFNDEIILFKRKGLLKFANSWIYLGNGWLKFFGGWLKLGCYWKRFNNSGLIKLNYNSIKIIIF